MRSLHAAASVIGIIHTHKSFPEFLVPSYVKAEIAVHWNLTYGGKQGCHPCLHLLIRYSTNSKKEISICVAGMVAVTIVADAVVVEIMEDAAMDAAETDADVVEMAVADAIITAAAGDGITGDAAVPADGTGITGKHSVTDSVKAMMRVSVMDSGKDGTMTADRADLVVLEVRGGREMAAIPVADAAEPEIYQICNL